jgi:hypothetical protein
MRIERIFLACTIALSAVIANAATFTVTNNLDSGPGSLRQAILDANTAAGLDRIEFALTTGSKTISVATVLPAITSPVAIDATTQTGYANKPLVTLDGGLILGVPWTTAGLNIAASGSSVSGLAITGFHVPNTGSTSAGAGIAVGNATGVIIKRCFLGVSSDGLTPAGNDIGIRLDSGASTTIGLLNEGNVISGNNRGVANWDFTATHRNTIQYNIIGLSADLLHDVPNTDGIYACGDYILNNRITGNLYTHISMTGAGGVVKGNAIGRRNGLGPAGFGAAGIVVYGGFAATVRDVTIGGMASGEPNEFLTLGIAISISAADNVQIVGNAINGNAGAIEITNSVRTRIDRNSIHDNAAYSGIAIRSGSGNEITKNSMSGNGFGIELGAVPSSPTMPRPNDPQDTDSGPNLGQNYPVITSATNAGTMTKLSVTFNSTPSTEFRIEFFMSDTCNSSGFGEGRQYVASTQVITDSSGNASFDSYVGFANPGAIFTATATDGGGNTSEFSRCTPLNGPGLFGISNTNVIVDETAGTILVPVTRFNGSAGTANVDYGTVNGTAIAGSDYTAVAGTLTFGPGETLHMIAIPILNDTLHELQESFHVVIANPTGGATIGPSSTGLVTINDDDPAPTISISNTAVVVQESAGTALVPVTRSGGSAGTVTVDYATGNATAIAGSDYTAVSGTLTFGPGETVHTISIPILNDNVHEVTESFNVGIANATGGATITPDASGLVFINDDDRVPTITIDNVSVTEGNAGTTNAVFNLHLSAASAAPLVASYFTQDVTANSYNADYTYTSGSLIFAPGETLKQVSVPVIGDTYLEQDETFRLYAYATSGGDPNYVSGTATILNDDVAAEVRLEDVSVIEGNAGTTTVSVKIHATKPITGPLYLYTTDGTARAGSDYRPESFYYLYFNNETEKTFDIAVYGDTEVEASEVFTVVVAANYTLAILKKSTATITILNDDIGIGPKAQLIANGMRGVIVINFGENVATDTTVLLSSSRPESFSVPETLVIPAGSRSGTFWVTALDAGSSARIDATLPPSVGGGVVSVTVRSYEAVTLELTPSPLTLAEGSEATVTARLSPAASDAQIITLKPTDASIIDAPSSITIPAGGAATFIVKGLKHGGAALRATLPAQYDSQMTSLSVDVNAATTTPVLFSVSPASGPAAGGTNVTINGGRLRSDCTVTFGGAPASSTFSSASSLTASTPAHTAGSVDVFLSCGSDTFALQNGFTYVAAGPTIANVSPSFGNVGGGTLVKVTGANLFSACGVSFGGVAARGVEADGTTVLNAIAPPHSVATVNVAVTCNGVSASRSNAFSYTTADEPAAAIASVDPLLGGAGQSVTITGLRFRRDDRITFGTTPATILSTRGDTHVVRVPDMPLGLVAITITDASGRVTTTGPIFTVVEAGAPRITTATPSKVTAGSELVLQGEGFRPGYTFAIGDRATPIVVLSSTRAIVRVPPMPGGSYPVDAINAAGNVAARGPSVTYLAGGVAVMSVSQACATTDGGQRVTINGNGFVSGASVLIGGVPATNVRFVNANTLEAMTAATNNAGVATITVMNPGGATATLSNAFRLTSPYDPDGCGPSRRRVGRQ